MLKKFCSCGRVINSSQKYCAICSSNKNYIYDKIKRNKITSNFYTSRRWKKLIKLIKSRCNGIDIYVLYKFNKLVPGEVVHHIYELEIYPEKAYELDNLIYVSKATHNKIHMIYKEKEKKIKLQKYLTDILQDFLSIQEGERLKSF